VLPFLSHDVVREGRCFDDNQAIDGGFCMLQQEGGEEGGAGGWAREEAGYVKACG